MLREVREAIEPGLGGGVGEEGGGSWSSEPTLGALESPEREPRGMVCFSGGTDISLVQVTGRRM